MNWIPRTAALAHGWKLICNGIVASIGKIVGHGLEVGLLPELSRQVRWIKRSALVTGNWEDKVEKWEEGGRRPDENIIGRRLLACLIYYRESDGLSSRWGNEGSSHGEEEALGY